MTGHRAGRALLAGALLLTLGAAGCGVRPSEVITGRSAVSGPSQGSTIYLLAGDDLVLVLRPTASGATSPGQALALLAAGPERDERDQGLTSEVPAGIGAAVTVTSGAGQSGGLTVRTTGAALTLSAHATDQIICTTVDAAAQSGLAEVWTAVTIVGPDGAQPPRRCSVR
ncbi:hypothetical protein O7634_27700 [Micromonospora sp. WMMD1120]|uniref:hypothetical protein n=1 Tax=Micromonospora sp. WMMD1120 TaxID=3016106 RepID=UPI00241748C4|nr:hypothetical protein [Micromonospora sp. WMMD1120]MDG4810557.1 hypothetical protein [Micromonospora sp. WMMD1120]